MQVQRSLVCWLLVGCAGTKLGQGYKSVWNVVALEKFQGMLTGSVLLPHILSGLSET
jgi:hypothetical protein